MVVLEFVSNINIIIRHNRHDEKVDSIVIAWDLAVGAPFYTVATT